MKLVVLLTSSMLVLSGCNTGGAKQTGGTLLGAAAGGLLGSTLGGGTGRVVAASVGAVGGAMLGSHLGRNMDDADRMKAKRHHYKPQRLTHEEMHKRGIPHRH